MSAGAFVTTFYTADDGTVHPLKVQPETLTMSVDGNTNAPTATAATTKYYARVGGGCREIGVRARRVNIKFDNAPAGYKQDQVISLPWVGSKAVFDAMTPGMAGTYDAGGVGSVIEVVSTSDECGAGNT
jgi:hypothetical protein